MLLAMTEQIATVTIRRLTETDGDAIAQLAELDTHDLPREPLLGAEVEGRLVAAVSLADGRVLSDPFTPTTEIQALLELRAAQLRRRDRRPRGFRLLARPRPRGALASSPPGAGGRLLSLPGGSGH
jgi:hypothetical protein